MTRPGFPDLETVVTTAAAWNEFVFNRLNEVPILDALRECLGGDPIFYSANIFSIADRVQADTSRANFIYPPGVVRCLVSLAGGDADVHWIFADTGGKEIRLVDSRMSLT